MTRLARLRARLRATSPTDQAVRIALGLMLLSGAVAGTSASFNATTSEASASVVGTDALNAPAAVTATASGNAVNVAWTAGSFGSGATTFGHRVRWTSLGVESGVRDGMDPPACTTGTSFASTLSNVAGSTTTATHTGAAATTPGTWSCYTVDSQYPQGASPQWFSQTFSANQLAVVQIGNVMRSVQFVNGNGADGTLGPNDQIVVTFSQPILKSTGPVDTNNRPNGIPTVGNSICTRTGRDLNIGRTGFAACANTEVNWVATVTGVTLGTNATFHTTWSWSGCTADGLACSVLTATVGNAYRNGPTSTVTFTGTQSVTPTTVAGKLTAVTGTGMCSGANTSTSTCRPVPIGTV